MVCSELDEESVRNPNDVSILPYAYLRKYRVPTQGRTQGGVGLNPPLSSIFYKNFIIRRVYRA